MLCSPWLLRMLQEVNKSCCTYPPSSQKKKKTFHQEAELFFLFSKRHKVGATVCSKLFRQSQQFPMQFFTLNGTRSLHVILAVPQLDLKSICSLDCPGYGVLTFPWHLFRTNKTICVRAKATNYSEKCGSDGSDAANGLFFLFFLFCHNPFAQPRCNPDAKICVILVAKRRHNAFSVCLHFLWIA